MARRLGNALPPVKRVFVSKLLARCGGRGAGYKVYWTGWIALHTTKKKELPKQAALSPAARSRVLWGLALLGFTSFYREGFEVGLFLQSYRLELGGSAVLY